MNMVTANCAKCNKEWDVFDIVNFFDNNKAQEGGYPGAASDFSKNKGCPSCNWGRKRKSPLTKAMGREKADEERAKSQTKGNVKPEDMPTVNLGVPATKLLVAPSGDKGLVYALDPEEDELLTAPEEAPEQIDQDIVELIAENKDLTLTYSKEYQEHVEAGLDPDDYEENELVSQVLAELRGESNAK